MNGWLFGLATIKPQLGLLVPVALLASGQWRAIAGAGGAAHLPGMIAALTHLPVLGVPVKSKALKGLDSLLSIVQMPKGVPVGTLAIGKRADLAVWDAAHPAELSYRIGAEALQTRIIGGRFDA